MKITKYELTTGTIHSLVTQSPEQPIIVNALQGYIEGHYKNKLYYIDITQNPVVAVARGDMNFNINKTTITADGVDECIISNIPIGTKCEIVKQDEGVLREIINDGVVELSSEQTGLYTITLTHPHYIKQEFEVTST